VRRCEAFNLLGDICSQHSLVLKPKVIVTDLEVGLRRACLTAWPLTSLLACRFHLGQAWWRKIQALGLANDYKQDTDVGKWLKIFYGLMFLEPSHVECCYQEIKSMKPRSGRAVNEFLRYMNLTYVSEKSKFPPRIWASPSSNLTFTTNACESFHSHFVFNSAHPHIFTFVDTLLTYQKEVQIKINSIGTPNATKNSHTTKKQTFIENQLALYRCKQLTSVDFVKRVSHYYSCINK